MLCISVAAMLAMALSGCEKKDLRDMPPPSDYFIRSYVDPPTQEQLEATLIKTGDVNPILLRFTYKSFNALEFEQYPCWLISPEKKWQDRKAVCDSLAKAHHDTEYKRSGKTFSYCQFVRTERIDVFSDTDYDAAHPAGTPLNDIVDIQFSSAEDYVQSNYTEGKYLSELTTPVLEYDDMRGGYYPADEISMLQEPLEEFNRIQRKLISFFFFFKFRSDPSQTAEHNFTIVYRNEQGLTLSSQVGPVLLKSAE